MSRSLGRMSLPTSPPIMMSPPVMSANPGIIPTVLPLPQPDGPTSTTNSWSAMSRSMPRTASVWSNFLTTLLSVTCAMALSLRRAGGEAGDVVVHEEGVDDQRRRRREQRRGHDHAPLIDVALDQGRDRSRRQHQLIAAVDERHGI